MEIVLVSLLNGLVYGMLLFMLASGLTLIFSMMGVLNFAHASIYMIGAYLAFTVSRLIGFFPALIVAPILCGLLGAAIEVWGLRRVHSNGHVAELLFTFGLVFIIQRSVQMIWGMLPMAYRVPPSLDFSLFTFYGEHFPAYRGFMLLVSAGMLLALWLLLKKTRVGMVIRAALTHPQMASALGHNVPMVFTIVFAGGCMLARRDALRAAGGMAAIRDALIDDCTLAIKLKAQGPIWIGLTQNVSSIRGYAALADIRHMVSRTAYAQLRYSPLVLAGTVIGLAITFIAPVVLALFAVGAARFLGLAAWLLMALVLQPTLRFYRVSPLWGVALPAIAAIYMAFTVDSAYQHWRGRSGMWKGRAQGDLRGKVSELR